VPLTLPGEAGANYARYLAKGVRPDGRPAGIVRGACRATSLWRGSVARTSGTDGGSVGAATALVGETRVVASATVLVGAPEILEPLHGELAFEVTTSPLEPQGRSAASGPEHPRERGRALGERLRDVFLGGAAPLFDEAQLGIVAGKSAWRVCVTLLVLNDQGNVFDALVLAAAAAITDARLPAVVAPGPDQLGEVTIVSDEAAAAKGNKSARPRPARPLALDATPVPMTCGWRNDTIVVDPTSAEEPLLALTTVVCAAETPGQVLCVRHVASGGGDMPPPPDALLTMCKVASARAGELAPMLL